MDKHKRGRQVPGEQNLSHAGDVLQGQDQLAAEALELLLESRNSPSEKGVPVDTGSARAARLVEMSKHALGVKELKATRDLLQAARHLDRRANWSEQREKRLVRSVLAKTTRLDPGWRGDLRLVLSFVGESVSRSRQLRAAAALLFVNCFVVLPAVAWVMLRPKPVELAFTTGIVAPPVALPEGEAEEFELDLPDELSTVEASQGRLDAERNTCRRARFVLMTQIDLPELTPSQVDPGQNAVAASLFEERLRLLRGGGVELTLSDLGDAAKSPRERSLLALLALDRRLVLGRSSELGPLLNELALAESDGRANALALHVLGRARDQGDWPGAAPEGWPNKGWGSGADQPLLPLGQAEERALRAVFGGQLESLRRR